MKMKLVGIVAALLLLLTAPALADTPLQRYSYEDLSAHLVEVGMVDGQTLQGQHMEYTAAVVQYEYDGEIADPWEGFPTLYGLTDTDRKILVLNQTGGGQSEYLWFPGDSCDDPVAVDIYCQAQRASDYFRETFHSESPREDGAVWTYLVTSNPSKDGISSDYSKDQTEGRSDEIAWILVGHKNKAEPEDLEIVLHEWTHNVLTAHGTAADSEKNIEGAAVHEAYADLIAVTAGDDWDFYSYRNLENPESRNGSGNHYLTRRDDFKSDTEEHDGSTILSHAGYLMCEGSLAGTALTREELAHLVYNSIQYLPGMTDLSFASAGRALILAGQTMRDSKASAVRLDDAKLERVEAALDAVGIDFVLAPVSASLKVPWSQFKLNVLDADGNGYDHFLAQLSGYFPSDRVTPPLMGSNPMEIDLDEYGFDEKTPVRLVLTDLADSSKYISVRLDIDPDAEGTLEIKTPFGYGEEGAPQINPEEALREILESRVQEYGLMETGRDTGVLGRGEPFEGLLNAVIADFDSDDVPELLISRFSVPDPGNLTLTLEMIEPKGSGTTKELRVPGIADFYGQSGSTASCFIFRSGDRWLIGLDTYNATFGDEITVALYAYNGQDLHFTSGACYDVLGEGDVFVRYAQEEGDPRTTLSGGVPMGEEKERKQWQTLLEYWVEEHDWQALSGEAAEEFTDAYRDMLDVFGLKIGKDIRITPEPIPENFDFTEWINHRYEQEPTDVYSDTDSFTPLWRIATWQNQDAETLIRQDYGDELEPFR